jgi:hypothetical protein
MQFLVNQSLARIKNSGDEKYFKQAHIKIKKVRFALEL